MMDKPATELLFIEEEELVRAAEALVDTSLICREVKINESEKKVSRKGISLANNRVFVDTLFYESKLVDKLFRSGDIPKLANVVNLDKL